MARANPHVFSVAPGAPFLPTLVDALFTGRFGALPDPAADPMALADVTIFLPTRRAARALHAEILARLGGRAAILPSIRPIGDVEEGDLLLEVAEPAADRLALPPAISRLDRLLVLTRLTLAWAGAVKRDLLGLAADDPLLIPASAADAFNLAGDLARLIDDIETAGIGWDKLAALGPDHLAAYWQITLDFLKIVGEAWPGFLAERHLADPAVRRDVLIRAEAARLAAVPRRGLIIAAGSTGSIPATAALLSTIAYLPNGAVLLPGLDVDVDATVWSAISGPASPGTAAPGHPQYGMKQLIEAIGIDRPEVIELGRRSPALALRARLLSDALLPAETTEAWSAMPPVRDAAIDGVALIQARNEQEEAVAIALALREAVETPGATAALITPDRRLAGRVAIELGRFGLAIDDSAGRPLMTSPEGTLARLAVAAASSNGAPIDLLALAKHPLARFGMARGACRNAIEILDISLFRGQLFAGGLAGLDAAVAAAKGTAEARRHVSAAVKRLQSSDWQDAQELAVRMARALAPLADALAWRERVSSTALTAATVAALRAIAADDSGEDHALFAQESGDALATLFAGLLSPDADALVMSGADYPAFLDAAMAGIAVPVRPGADPRLFIWGTLEARLQTVDLAILAGLDESVWPADIRTDPWLSRSMRAEIGLEAPERRLGLAAHDFAGAFLAPRVIVTRAERRGGTPTVTARWLQRLLARLGKDKAKAVTARGQCYLDWARALDRSATLETSLRPRPRPPVEARPRRLSVTEIETLVRDPYAIYARRILRLEPLDPIGVIPDAALRGTLIHDALGRFIQDEKPLFGETAYGALLALGQDLFRTIEPFPDVHALWWPRFRTIADWFLRWEQGRDLIAERLAEIDGRWKIEAPAGTFMLTGRADRIDIRRDGSLEILDFKTGAPPTAKQLSTGLAPQLALEVAMAKAGAFEKVPPGRSVATLGWLGLGRVGRGDPFSSAVKSGTTADALGDEAAKQLFALIAAYDDRAGPMCHAPGRCSRPGSKAPTTISPASANGRSATRRRANDGGAITVDSNTRYVQARATDPAASAWVSANAGSGKTYVLARASSVFCLRAAIRRRSSA